MEAWVGLFAVRGCRHCSPLVRTLLRWRLYRGLVCEPDAGSLHLSNHATHNKKYPPQG